MSQDVVVEAPAQSEVKDVVLPKEEEKECIDREKKSRAFSTDWVDLCESLGKGQD